MKKCALLIAGLWAQIAVSDRDLVFPYVALGEEGESTDEWKDFKAQVMDVQNDLTTYSVGCATDPCAGWGNLPDFTYTMVLGQNTFDMKYSDEPILSTSTDCTFMGSPPTAASCAMTNTGHILSSDLGYEHHFTVPWTEDSFSATGNWDLYNIMSATMRIVDGTATASGSKTTAASTGGSGSGPSVTDGGPLVTPASSTASTGAAMITGVPGWVVGVGMGVAAGAALGV